MSLPFVLDLIENEKAPFHFEGSERRIRLDDLARYKELVDATAESAR